jgi:hypothetical protein
MKIIIFCLLLSSNLFAQSVSQFNQRVEKIDEFKLKLTGHKESIANAIAQIKDFNPKNILDVDQAKKNDLLMNLESMNDNALGLEHYFSTTNIKKTIAEYQRLHVDRTIYQRYEKEVLELEKYNHHSQRLAKFIDHYKRGKYTVSRIDYTLLSRQEKKVADDYSFKKDFVLREAGIQKNLLSELAVSEKKIDQMLQSAESAMEKIHHSHQRLVDIEDQFVVLKNELAKIQINFTADPWKMGHFSCDSKSEPAQYQRFKNFPNLISLGNLGNHKAVLKHDPKTGEVQVVYSCRKSGQFGGCLDNFERELCKINPACQESMNMMEQNYNRAIFFNGLARELSQKILLEKEQVLRNRSRTNLIHEYAKLDKLLHFTEDQLYAVYTLTANKINQLKTISEANFVNDVKKILDESSKQMLQELARNNPGSSGGKINDTKNMINYVHQSILSDVQMVLNDDVVQEFAYSKCPLNLDPNKLFCLNFQSMKARGQLFQEIEPLENLLPHKCPQVALRFNQRADGCINCKLSGETSSVIIDFQTSLQDIILNSK